MQTLRTPSKQWQVVGTVFKIVFGMALLLVAVILLFVTFGSSTDYYKVMTVLSGSMEPTLPRGALIVDVPVPLAEVQVGDIITFQLPDAPSVFETHRVKAILQQGIQPIVQTQGDANVAPDPWRLGLVTEPAWKVVAVIPGLGYTFEWLRVSGAQAIAAIALPVILAILWIRDIWKSSGYYNARHKARLQ